MPAGRGEEERFAAAVENGTTPAFVGRGDDGANGLARELEVVALLRSGAAGLGPEPAARARARGRLMAAFAQEFGHDADGTVATSPFAAVAPVALAEREEPPAPTRRHGVTATSRPSRAGRHSAPEPELPGHDDPELDVPRYDDEPEQEPAHNVRRLRSRRSGTARRGHGRAAVLGAAAAAALVALAGGGTFASRDALPGEPLYGVKRVAEQTSYALTFGEQAKARRHLEQAQRRLDEVEGMVARNRTASATGAPAPASDPDLVRSTMQEFDADTDQGARQLLSGPSPDTAQVEEVRTWATQQSERLSEIRSTLPAPDRADESLALLDRVLGQTQALSGDACPDGTATDVTCDPSGPVPDSARTSTTTPSPDPDATAARSGASATSRSDDDGDARSEGGADARRDDDTASARTTAQGSGGDDRDDWRQDDRSGSGGSGGSGSGDLSVPVPLPATVNVPPPVPGLPGISLGGR